jgi:hypothetical protein
MYAACRSYEACQLVSCHPRCNSILTIESAWHSFKEIFLTYRIKMFSIIDHKCSKKFGIPGW